MPDVRPAFIHVDVDNLWAIAECYGLSIPRTIENFVYEDALPRFAKLYAERGIRATFFIVGRDCERDANRDALRDLVGQDHALGNHSYSHRLDFRALSREQISDEVSRAHSAITESSGQAPKGFRAPGYAVSPVLQSVLNDRGYLYDSSLMPSPFGFVFRTLDAGLRKTAQKLNANPQPISLSAKTQYPQLADAGASLRPQTIKSSPSTPNSPTSLIELPAATAPLLRLPFQAGVCMRLGRHYFDMLFNSFARARDLPLLFLAHAADLCDFSALNEPFFSRSKFFSMPIERKLELMSRFLDRIQGSFEVQLAEIHFTADSLRA